MRTLDELLPEVDTENFVSVSYFRVTCLLLRFYVQGSLLSSIEKDTFVTPGVDTDPEMYT